MRIGLIETPTRKELFVSKIEEMILSGKLNIGDRLPTERELVEETHISKTVIHAGLAELEGKGFLEIIPRKGTFVANYMVTGTLETLNAQLRHNGGVLNARQIDSLQEVRLAVEGAALQKLAAKHSDEDIAALRDIVDKAQSCADKGSADETGMAELLFSFEREVCARSGNLIFPLLLNDYKPVTMVFWESSVRFFGAAKNVHLIKRYVDEIAAGDSEAVYRRLKRSSATIVSAMKDGVKGKDTDDIRL